jgi:molybdate transport system permease protein
MEEVEIKDPINNKSKFSNIIFTAIISIFTALLIGFIVAAIGMILMKGVPNLGESLKTKEIIFSIKLSLFTSFISTLLCIIVAIPVSYGVIRTNFFGKRIVNAILDIPLALPPVVSGVALLLLFGNTEFGHFLASIGFKFTFTVSGIILAQFFVNVPYMMRILKSTIADIDPRIEFVSRTLGCNKIQSFFKVTLPLAKNGLIASIVITWARSLGEFGAALMLAGATRMKTETLPVSLYLNMSCGDLKLGLAAASILIIISIFSLLIFETLGGKTIIKM